MEGIFVLLIIFTVFAPIALSVIAFIKVFALKGEVETLQRQLCALRCRVEEPIDRALSASFPVRAPVLSQAPLSSAVPEHVAVAPVSVEPPKPVGGGQPVDEKPKLGLEFLMGGKAAAFAGIAILVMGVVFLVGYAMQHSWIGPGARVILGLLAGGSLVGGGHFVGQRDERYTLFARVLTGGGSALFYFSVFAAYGIYHLIGAVAAGAGLFASALAVFGLAMAYRSQSVAVLGVLGAFVTPLLIGGELDAGVFPLVYVALINVPVLLLGIRRKWQLLYNLAFVFTFIHYLIWLDRLGVHELGAGLIFAILFFGEFAALGLLKLRREPQISGRTADRIRLVCASLLLLGAVYWLLDDAEQNQWVGAAFVLLALVHVALARFSFKVLTRFNGEILSFLAGGLVFATLALPAQLDGEWVSLGWAIEGAVLAWFAVRVQSRSLQAGALLLGLIGLSKALVFDGWFYSEAPGLFWNARFAVGMLSAVLIGVQGWLAGRFPEKNNASLWQDVLWWLGILGALLMFFSDAFWTLGPDDPLCWLITSLMLLGTGAGIVLAAPAKSSVTLLGSLFLLAVPLKLFLVDSVGEYTRGGPGFIPFAGGVIWVELVALAWVVLVLRPRLACRNVCFVLPAIRFVSVLNLLSLAAAIGIVTLEILRGDAGWAGMAVTIFWAVCALSLILFGMKRQFPVYRYFGLVLFGITSLKVLLIDSSELDGLVRIFAFIGTGILLLALSFAYQKATVYFLSLKGTK